MIADNQTNTIYFSELLKTSKSFKYIEHVLKEKQIKFTLLNDTNDIWARDYMPIQVSDNKFVEFRYDPDYLQGAEKGYRNLKTYPDMVCDKLGLKTEKSDLILDGGNVVKSSNCIILTDKVVIENRHLYSKPELISMLQVTFEVDKVVLIPWDLKDEFGHADGMVRFIDNKTVLVNALYKTDTVLVSRLINSGLNCEFLNYNVRKQNKNNWAYINFSSNKGFDIVTQTGG